MGLYVCCYLLAYVSAYNWQPPQRSLDGYKHVVDVEYCRPVSCEGPHFPPEAIKAKEAAQNAPNKQNTLEYHDIVEGCSHSTRVLTDI